ncbi:MAG: hypothetical protein LJE84_11390 [Gammaproteobacteria bacterium]|nr:hypothetical protein [Gammaproteobacteria bacterium]
MKIQAHLVPGKLARRKTRWAWLLAALAPALLGLMASNEANAFGSRLSMNQIIGHEIYRHCLRCISHSDDRKRCNRDQVYVHFNYGQGEKLDRLHGRRALASTSFTVGSGTGDAVCTVNLRQERPN